ncbi:MAG: DUF4136 domain-containing protein [Candidatus Brocadia sp. WS118]|nr:MAG: DUF4136 domain-containing protein [Candidatus Brocadia sp. WS118]
MRSILLSSMFALLLILTSCSSLIVRHDYDREYNFNQYKTYRWPADSEIDKNDVLARNSLVYKRVQAAVDKELKAKGFTLQESGETDFVVVAHAGVKDKMQIHQYGGGRYGWYDPWWGPYGGYTDVSYYQEGTLVIDIVDLKSKELAWRGTGSGVVKEYNNPDKMQKDLNAAVAKVLANFPPGAATK